MRDFLSSPVHDILNGDLSADLVFDGDGCDPLEGGEGLGVSMS